ncbi:MAG: nucleotidyltransferase domain-containing protein [Actinobacteria bacterium]|nr:nucleotidyltransferase domain-containing protein [Actinomycetota bacterium]
MCGKSEANSNRLPEDVARYVKALVEKLNPVAVVLFGSRATGRAHIQSDYDLLVIAPNLPGDFWVRQDLVWEGKPFSVDVIAFTLSEVIERVLRGFVLDALLQGVVLFGDIGELKARAEEHVERYGLTRTEAGYVRRPA